MPPWSPGSKQHTSCRHQRGQRHAAAEPLAERQDVGLHARVLVRAEAAGAADAGLDLVEDQQHAALAGERAQRDEVVVVGRDHAGLALDRLEHDGDGALA